MQKCISKDQIRCIYLTKDNYEQFLKETYPSYKNDYINVEVTDKEVIVNACDMVHTSRNYSFGWWVEESSDYEYPQWWYYTDDEFKEKYMIIS